MQLATTPSGERRAQLRSEYVYLVLLPIASVVLSEFAIDSFAQSPVTPDSTNWTVSAWGEAGARLQLLAMLFLYTLCCLAIIYKSFRDLVVLIDGQARKQLLKIYLLQAIAALILFGAEYAHLLPGTVDLLGRQMYHEAFKAASKYGEHGFWSEQSFFTMLYFALAVSVLATAGLIAGTISCLAKFHRLDDAENWIYQSERFKTYVYMSAALLVIGVLCQRPWMQYPGFLLDGGALAKYTALVSAVSVWTGVELTILLSSYAVPVVLILSQQANHIAARIIKEEERLEAPPQVVPFNKKVMAVREREKLTVTTQDVLKTIVAILAPLLTGALHNLSSVLG